MSYAMPANGTGEVTSFALGRQSRFRPGPGLRAALQRIGENDYVEHLFGFRTRVHALERLTLAIGMDWELEALREPRHAAPHFAFGPHARLELSLMGFTPANLEEIGQAIRRDLAEEEWQRFRLMLVEGDEC